MSQKEIDQLVDQDYKYGFVTDIESDTPASAMPSRARPSDPLGPR